MLSLRPLVVTLACVVACSSSSGSPATSPARTQVDGTLGGSAFGALDAVTVDIQVKGADFFGTTTFVLVSAYASACTTSFAISGERSLAFVLGMSGGAADDAGGVTGSPVAGPGTYVVAPASGSYPMHANVAVVFYEVGGGEQDSGVSGTVTVISKGTSGIQATFDVTMASGDHITGAFNASACPTLNPN